MITLREYDAARNVATYVVDTEAEITQLPNLATGDDINGLGPIAMGSEVICLENMTLYILDGNNEYVAFGSGNGGGGGSRTYFIKLPKFNAEIANNKIFEDLLYETGIYTKYKLEHDGPGEVIAEFTVPDDGKTYYAVPQVIVYDEEDETDLLYTRYPRLLSGNNTQLDVGDNYYIVHDSGEYNEYIIDVYGKVVHSTENSYFYEELSDYGTPILKNGETYVVHYCTNILVDTGDAELDALIEDERDETLGNLYIVLYPADEFDIYETIPSNN